MSEPLYKAAGWMTASDEELTTAFERFRIRKSAHPNKYRCPACLQEWYWARSLRRHMAILHHRCRFCTKAYIMVDVHERRSHTIEWALAAGACENRP